MKEKEMNKICKVSNCNNRVKARGYCGKHYYHILKHGKILERTIYDLNDYVNYEDYIEIILRNHDQEEIARTQIDREDKWLLDHKWCYSDTGYGYAYTRINGITKKLHQLLFPNNSETDHKNRNGLDNRKQNRRSCTRSENSQNQGTRTNNTTGTRGVSFYRQTQKYHAEICVRGQRISLGYYNTLEDAAQIRRQGELDYFGEFAPEAAI